jgi:hypothetical protein
MRERKDRLYRLEEVLPHAGVDAPRLDLGGDLVKVHTLRMLTFKTSGVVCSRCGLSGEYFAKERTTKWESYHLELYAVKDGAEVLMTHDHVLARSLGGADDLSNTQTMCSPCNTEKGVDEAKLLEARRATPTEK